MIGFENKEALEEYVKIRSMGISISCPENITFTKRELLKSRLQIERINDRDKKMGKRATAYQDIISNGIDIR